jgi:hypothetical protein
MPLVGCSLSLKTVTAIDRASLTWLERHLGLLATLIADDIEHLARRASTSASAHCATAITGALATPLGSTPGAPNRVHEPTFTEETLLSCRKDELRVAVTANDDLVFPVHESPDSLLLGVPSVDYRHSPESEDRSFCVVACRQQGCCRPFPVASPVTVY